MSQNVLPRAAGDLASPGLRAALALLAGLFLAACEGREVTRPPPLGQMLGEGPRPRPTPAARASAAFEGPALSIERPIEPSPDPPGPVGDLRSEIESFRDLAACVRSHRLTDPLLADGLDAIGYDTFVADSCRAIEALAARDPAPCAAMLSSALRRRCEEQVAMLTGQSALCPTTERVPGVPVRDPLCLAVARRDLRTCTPLRGLDRATCEGLLAHDLARCGVDERCLRLLRRWTPVIPVAPYHPPHAGHLEVEVRTPGEPARTVELPREAEAGAIVVARPGGVRLLVGDPRTFFVVDEVAGGGLVLDLPSWPPGPAPVLLAPPQARATLRLVASGALELARDGRVRVVVEQAPTEPGRPVKLRVDATFGPPTAPRSVTWTIETWLREGPSAAVAPTPAASAPRAR